MSGRRPKQLIASILALLLLWPQWALAQSAAAPAGVVTTLAGQATVARTSLSPQPLPLKFKDQVFVRDTIRTQERSVVRMLLGGKALVTVRELSVFTITEQEGRSSVDLETGKLALSVARQRMRPGETIEPRTPNAVAGVRGTVVIAEVVRATAQAAPPTSGVTTNLYVLRGSIDVVPRGVPTAVPVTVGPLQALSLTGATAGQIRQIPPGQIGQIVSGLKSGPQHQDTPEDTKKQVSAKEHAKASALATLLAPDPAAPAATQEQQSQGTQQDTEQTDPTLFAASSPTTDSTTPDTGGTTGASTGCTTCAPIVPAGSTPTQTSTPDDVPSATPVSGETKLLTSSETLFTFPAGTAVQQQANTLVSVDDSTVTQTPAGDLILSPAGSNSSIKGILLDALDSTLEGGRVLRVAGTLSSSTDLIRTDPTFVTAPNLIQIDATGSLTVQGSLLTDVGGTFSVSGDVVTVFGSLSTTGAAAPAVSLDTTTMESGTDFDPTHFFRVTGASGVATMAGPLVTASGGSFTQRGSAILEVSDGGTLTGTGASPFMSLSGGSLTLGSGVVGARIETGSTATLAGALFTASSTTLDVSGSGKHFIEVSGASSLTAGGGVELSGTSLNLGTEPLVKLLGASTLRFTGASPALKLTSASLTADQLIFADGSGNTFQVTGTAVDLTSSTLTLREFGDTDSGLDTESFTLGPNQPLVKLASSTLTTTDLDEGGPTLGDNAAGVPPIEPGVGLVATGTTLSPTTINIRGKLFKLEAGTFTATDPLVQLDHTTVNQTGTFKRMLRADFGGAISTMAGGFLRATSSTLNASRGFFEFEDGLLVSATTSPFFSLSSTDITSPAGHVLSLPSSAILTLAGGLFSSTGGTIDAVNPSFDTALASVGTGTSPESVALTPDGARAYVANGGANTVSVIDTGTNTAIATVAVGASPNAVAVTPDGARAYVADSSANTVSVIDTGTNTVVATVPVGTTPSSVAIGGSRAYVPNSGANTVSVIDTGTNTVVATILVGTAPAEVSLTPDGSRAYVRNSSSSDVSVIDTATNGVIATVPVGSTPKSVAFKPDGSRAYVANQGSNTVSVIDNSLALPAVLATVAVGSTPTAIALMPDGSRAYVSNAGSNTVSVLDTATNTVTATVSVGTTPRDIVITPDGSRAYVLNKDAASVSVIYTSNNTVIATVSVGANPNDVAIAPDGDRLYVLNKGSASVSVIDTDPGGRFLKIGSGTVLVSAGTASLLKFDGSTVSTGKTFVGIDGTLALDGTLVEAVNGAALSSIGSFLGVFAGGTLLDTASAPSSTALLSFTGGSLASTAGNLVTVSGNPGSSATMWLNRPLFYASGTAVSAFFSFLRIADGGAVESTATLPLVGLVGGSYTCGSGGGFGPLLRMFSLSNESDTSLTLAGGFLKASGGATLTAFNGPLLDIRDSATVSSTGGVPFLDFSNATATAAFQFVNIGPGSSSSGASGTNVPPTAIFAGPLMRAADTGTVLTFSSGNGSTFLRIFDGATVTGTGTGAFLDLAGTAPGKVVVNAAGNFVSLITTASGKPAPTLTLAGPLVSGQNAIVTSGDPSSNTNTNVLVADGAELAATSTAALMSFTDSTVTSAGNILAARRSASISAPTKVTLSGQLLVGSGSTFNTTSQGFSSPTPAACCNGFSISQGAQLTSSVAAPLIQLTGSIFNSGPDANSGGNFFGIYDTFTGAPSDQLVAPASVSLTGAGGSLLSVTDGSLSALYALLSVSRSDFTSGGTGPLITFGGSTGPAVTLGGFDPIAEVTTTGGRLLSLVSSPTAGTAASPASVSLAGQLLSSTKGSITATGELVGVFNGAALSSAATSPLLSLATTSLTTGTSPFSGGGQLLYVGGQGSTSGTTFASVSLHGPVLGASSSPLDLRGGLIYVAPGGQLTTNGNTDPLFSITGGAHSIATLSGSAVGRLVGRTSATALDTETDHEGTQLTLATDLPVIHEGIGLEMTGATVSGAQKALILDSALIDASAPLLHLKAASGFTTALDALNLQNKAKFESFGPIVKLDGSTLTVTSGAVVNVSGGSLLRVTGDLILMTNGSTLNVLSGPVLSLTDGSVGSVVNISGALIAFGTSSGNTVSVTNTLCAAGCSTIGGLKVSLLGGATAGQVSITNPIKNQGTNTFSVSATGAVISVNGPKSKLTISGF